MYGAGQGTRVSLHFLAMHNNRQHNKTPANGMKAPGNGIKSPGNGVKSPGNADPGNSRAYFASFTYVSRVTKNDPRIYMAILSTSLSLYSDEVQGKVDLHSSYKLLLLTHILHHILLWDIFLCNLYILSLF